MKLQLEPYIEQLKRWPKDGHHIMAQYDANSIIVYQSYRPEIGLFAADHQKFGAGFSLDRMTWIKPNFLWMMFRNGWGLKLGQEVVLAIRLKREAFEKYLANCAYSSFESNVYESKEAWRARVDSTSVRLQWDPDHDPYGEKLSRRAIQIGLKNEMIRAYASTDIVEIEDITEFVAEQRQLVQSRNLDALMIPAEKPFFCQNEELNAFLQLKAKAQ